jgi:iron complex outermembrane receptor protein
MRTISAKGRRASAMAGLSLLALAAATAVHAEDKAETTDVDQLVVTAARTILPASALPLTVDVIDSEALSQQVTVSGSIVDAVSTLSPSFSPTRQKLSGAGETLRGRSPLYAINGIPQSTPIRDGSRDGYTIDPFFIDRVEVIYGSNALQGIGATGGVVNQVTVGPPKRGRRQRQGPDPGHGRPRPGRQRRRQDRRPGRLARRRVRRHRRRRLRRARRLLRRRRPPPGHGQHPGRRPGLQGPVVLRPPGLAAGRQHPPGRGGQPLRAEGRRRLRHHHDQRPNPAPDQRQPRRAPADHQLPRRPARRAGGQPGRDRVGLADQHDLAGGNLIAQLFFNRSRDTFGGDINATFQDASIAPDGTLFDQSSNRSRKLGARVSYERAIPGIKGLTGTVGLDTINDRTEQLLIETGRAWVPPTKFQSVAPFVQGNLSLLRTTRCTSPAGCASRTSS